MIIRNLEARVIALYGGSFAGRFFANAGTYDTSLGRRSTILRAKPKQLAKPKKTSPRKVGLVFLLTKAWQSLTPAQRAAWDAYAVNYPLRVGFNRDNNTRTFPQEGEAPMIGREQFMVYSGATTKFNNEISFAEPPVGKREQFRPYTNLYWDFWAGNRNLIYVEVHIGGSISLESTVFYARKPNRIDSIIKINKYVFSTNVQRGRGFFRAFFRFSGLGYDDKLDVIIYLKTREGNISYPLVFSIDRR